jgi:group I intron endonuclease
MTTPANTIGLIYLVTNLINGKQYVGQTVKTLDGRWREHQNVAARGRGHLIAAAIRKYGAHNFRVTELTPAISISELNILETLYIAGLDTFSPRGYNLDSGGANPIKHPETRARISARAKGRPSWRKGKKHKPESILKMSLAKKGCPPTRKGATHTPEAKAKLSAARKGKPGHPHTEEFKARLSERNKGNTYMLGRKQSPDHVRKRIENSQRTRRLNATRS